MELDQFCSLFLIFPIEDGFLCVRTNKPYEHVSQNKPYIMKRV